MDLQTKVIVKPQQQTIGYDAEVVLLGSCFAENIGNKFEYFKFKNLINPFGILFHSKAIETFLWMATQGETYTEADVFAYNDLWHSFDAHSSLSNVSKNTILDTLNTRLLETFNSLKSASHIIITLGTAWVYKLKDLDMVVANCHKVPQREFDKILLSDQEIVQQLKNCVEMVKNTNPDITIIFTVSPVRHVKDGIVENNRSKAHLLTAVHEVVESNASLFYFPSYEIMMDELRDYRFYDSDMIHPSSLAIDLIWEKFVTTWVSKKATDTMWKVEEIQKALAHKPFNPKSEKHQHFLQKLESKKKDMLQRYPFMNF